MSFDTHKAFVSLKKGGFTDEQADTIIGILSDQGGTLVTNEKLESTISKLRMDLIYWQVGIAIALFSALKLVH